ncbi:MAG TPA: MFS transporter [Candidatus Hydrogenedentes bacterium]|nr:MFS transporter [Candidatus Hydrogenedentota bacterium]
MAAQLSWREKILYGLGGMAMSLPDTVFTQWIFMRYVPNAQEAVVNVKLFGFFYFTARIVGAIAEPVIGNWSDNFRSPSGRRLPFVRRTLIPFAFAFFMMWFPPVQGMHWVNAVYAYVMIQAYLLCFPTVITPYLALMPELTPDLNERVTLTTLQAVAIMLGTILFAVMGIVLKVGGWLALGLSVSFLMIVAMAPTALTIRERISEHRQHEKQNIFRSIRSMLDNRPYVYLVLSTTLFFFGFNSVVMALPFWVKIYLGKGEDMVTYLMAPFLVVTMVLFTAVGPAVKVVGKRLLFLFTMISITVLLGLFSCVGFFPLGSPLLQTAVLVALVGVPMTGFTVLPFTLLADVIDYDEKRTGQRREALFFAFQGTIQKVGLAFSGISFSLIAFLGSGNEASEMGLRCVLILAAVSSLAGFCVFLKYPLREREGKVEMIDNEGE